MSRFETLTTIILFLLLHAASLSANQISTNNITIEPRKLFHMSMKELMNVEITAASKVPERISEIPARVTLVTRNDIEKYGYSTLTEILENVAGFYNVYSYNGVSGNFGIRGFFNPRAQNSNVVILVNGVSQLKDDDRSNPFEKITVPVEAIDRIEVIRGPMSVIYGNGASFGVINIVTNLRTDHKYFYSASYGSLNTNKIFARAVAEKQGYTFILTASQYQTDGLHNKYLDMTSVENFATFPDFGVTNPEPSTKDVLENKNRYFNFSGANKHWYFDLTYNETDVGLFILLPPVGEGTKRSTTSKTVMMGYKREITDGFKLNSRVIFNDYYHKTKFDVLIPDSTGFQTIEYQAYEIEILSNLRPSKNVNIVAGVNYRRVVDFKDFVTVPQVGVIDELVLVDDRPTGSLFTQATYYITDNIKLIAGFRHEKVFGSDFRGFTRVGSDSQTTFGSKRESIINNTPRIAAIYTIDNSNLLKLMYGEARRVSEDSFEPEKTKTFEVNHVYTRHGFLSSASLFYNKLDKLLVKELIQRPDGSVTEEDRSSGEISTIGIEKFIGVDLTDRLFSEIGLTYQHATDRKNKDITVAYSPKTVFHATLSYKYNKHIISLLTRYVSSMESRYDVLKQKSDGTLGARIGSKVDGKFVVDINYRINKLFRGMYLNLRATNIFDVEIRYPNNPFSTELLDRGTLGPGRQLIGSLGWKF